MKPVWIFIIAVFLLSACAPAEMSPTATIIRPPTASSTVTLNPTITQTSTPTFTQTLTPTSTVTPSPTATSTPVLPVVLETALPQPLQPINAANVDQIKELARYERYDLGKILVRSTQDHKLAYVASTRGIDLYDIQTQKLLQHFDIILSVDPYYGTYISTDLQISADGNRFAASPSSKNVVVISQKGEKIFSFDFPAGLDYGGKALSPDGKLLAIDICSEWCRPPDKSEFKIFNVDTGAVIYEYKVGTEARGRDPKFSGDGKYLITSLKGEAYLWNTSDWKRAYSFNDSSGTFRGQKISFSPDGSRLAVSGFGVVNIWQLPERKLLNQIKAGYTPDVVFSPDNKTIATEGNNTLAIWTIADGKKQSEMTFIDSLIYGAWLENDGKLNYFQPLPEPGKTYGPWEAIYRPDNFLFIPGRTPPELDFATNNEGACAIMLGGKPVCASGGYVLGSDGQFYKAISDKGNHTFDLHQGLDGSGSQELSFHWWGEELIPVGLDPTHKFFFYKIWSGNFSVSYLMDYRNGLNKNIAEWPQVSMSSPVYSWDKHFALITFYRNPGIKNLVFDLENRQMVLLRDLTTHSAGGKAISVDLINVSDYKKPVRCISEDPHYVCYSQVFSPDGSLIAVLLNGKIRLIQTPDGKLLKEIDTGADKITALAFSEDGKLLASWSSDSTLKIWGIWP